MGTWPDHLQSWAAGFVTNLLKKKTHHQVLEHACHRAIFNDAERWLCAVDEVVSRLEPLPSGDWPLLMHLLVVYENLDHQAPDFFVNAASKLELRAELEKNQNSRLAQPYLKKLWHLCDLLRLRGTWLGATTSQIETVEELSECIDSSVMLPPEIPVETVGRINESNFNAEEAVILAQKALRAFTGKMQKHAFNTAPTQAGVLPMPSASDVLQAARSLEADFPLLWLRLAIEQIANECSAANARSVPAAEAAPKTGDGDSISAVAKSKPSRRKQSADPQPVSRLRMTKAKKNLFLKP
ncbi:unnamed protein product [Durusdinium trenchii]|uniref:Uncharacterized protein n=1 Tax=Durusdinium trenchii TaxID=1381693 RepID=A0ABP0J9U1_9DINO